MDITIELISVNVCSFKRLFGLFYFHSINDASFLVQSADTVWHHFYIGFKKFGRVSAGLYFIYLQKSVSYYDKNDNAEDDDLIKKNGVDDDDDDDDDEWWLL